MREWLGKRWVLLLVLAVFVICKLPHLSYPFYWDESWPYEAAIKAMYAHGPSLMPGAINPDLSRGHPLFFHVAAAVWMRVFGTGHVSQYSFALLIALLLLILVYEAGLRMFNTRVAVMSLLLISTQVVFFVQSSFMLPEVLLSLLVFASLYFYAQNKFLLAGITLILLFFTKESGLVAGFVIGIDAVINLFNKRESVKAKVLKLLAIAVPCVLIGVFFVLQKHLLGWYIFPLHNNMIENKISSFWYNFKYNCVTKTFYMYLRYWYFIMIGALCVIVFMKNTVGKRGRYMLFVWPLAIAMYIIAHKAAGDVPGLFIVAVMLVWMMYCLKKLHLFQNERQQKIMILLCAFIFCFLCFSSAIFFTYRYLMEAIVALLFFIAVLLNVLLTRTCSVLYYPVLVAIILIAYVAYRNDDMDGDCDPGAFTAMEMEQGVVNYLEAHNAYDKVIGTGSFMNTVHLTDLSTGFLHTDRTFTKVRWGIDNTADYALYNSNEDDPRYADIRKFGSFHLVYRFQKDKLWAEIYERQ